MKRLSFFIVLLFVSFFSKAQFFETSYGPVFPDPEVGVAKILQLKNGNTIYLHINFITGLDIQLYDGPYKARIEGTIQPAYGKLEAGKVEGIFEINGDVVVLLTETNKTETILYRLIIDAKTVKLKEEKQLARVKRIVPEKGGNMMTEIAVSKDPNSEHYAVATIGAFTSDTSKRIEISLYGAENKEIKKGYYASAVEKYKYLQYIDMAVIGADKVAMLLSGYNIENGSEKVGDVVLATLDKSTGPIAISDLYYSSDLVIEAGITRYDPETKRLILLTTGKLKSESLKESHAYIGFIDHETRKLVTNEPVDAGLKVKAKYAEIFGKKKEFNGMPQNLFVNPNRTYTIVFEDREVVKQKDTVSYTLLGTTAIATFDLDGVIQSSYLVPMDHYVSNVSVPAFYQSRRDAAGQLIFDNGQYKSSAYISDGHISLVLYNDKDANSEFAAGGKLAQFKDIPEADAFFSSLTGNEIMPKRQYVFGKPVKVGDEIRHTMGIFTVYDYDRANNVLVVLKQDKESNRQGVKLVWLQP